MIVAYAHDGSTFDESLVSTHGFILNEKKDIKEAPVYDPDSGDKTDRTEVTFDFVGFVTNKENNMLTVFPKHFCVSDKDNDSRILFDCIAKHEQKHPGYYIGENSDEKYESNFPFAAFFKIFDYYRTYGLYFVDESFIKPNASGKLSWKDTVSRSQKAVMGGKLTFFPLYFRRNCHFANFITECMIFAIDYTVSKFGVLIDAQGTGQDFPEFDFPEEKEYVVTLLQQFKTQIFKDNVLSLIDSLIDFFSDINVGGPYYLKHYTFSSIWEDMVNDYLCKYYKEVAADHSIVFDKTAPKKLIFEKESFHTNSAKPPQYISPDHYCIDGNNQLIFDAKYYNRIDGMNYKQIAYMFMLRGIMDPAAKQKKYDKTYSALILPSENRKTKLHFQLAPEFGGYPDLIITEEYLNIREMILDYIN